MRIGWFVRVSTHFDGWSKRMDLIAERTMMLGGLLDHSATRLGRPHANDRVLECGTVTQGLSAIDRDEHVGLGIVHRRASPRDWVFDGEIAASCACLSFPMARHIDQLLR